MFILDTEQAPATAQQLCSAIDLSLRKWIMLPADSAPARSSGELPDLASLAVDVSKGLISSTSSLPFEQPSTNSTPGPTIDSFTITGNPILLADTPLQLAVTASHACFAYSPATNGKLIAALIGAADGRLQLSVNHTDLEAGILKLARDFAGDSVAIQKIDIDLSPVSPTELNVLATITAKKFVSAVIRVTGNIKIDDRMIATASNLKAASQGMVGAIAVGLLQPQLQKIDAKPLPLMAFSLGKVKLHGVEVHTQSGIQITARFGSSES